MPDLDAQKKRTATDVATQPASTTSTTTPSGRDRLRTAAGATSYEEGSAMLRPDRAPVPGTGAEGELTEEEKAAAEKKKEEERVAAAKRSYEQALGKFLGGHLFDLVHKELSPDKLLGYGKDGIEAMGAVTDLIEPTGEGAAGGIMDEASEAEAVKKLADALVAWAQGEAVKWLEGDDGAKLLTKVNHWVEGHPRTVAASLVGAALAAAAIAYASNVSLSDLGTDFKITDSLSGSASVDLGKIQDLALKSAELGLKYQADGVKAGLKGTYESGEEGDVYGVSANASIERNGHQGDASASYRTDGTQAYGLGYSYDADKKDDQSLQLGTRGDAKLDAEGNLVLSTRANLSRGRFASEISSSRTSDSSGEVTAHKTTAHVAYGDPSNLREVDGTFDHTKNEFTLSTAHTRLFEGDNYSLRSRETYGPEGHGRNLTGRYDANENTAITMGVNTSGDRVTNANAGVKYSRDWLKAQLDLKMNSEGTSTASGSVEATRGNWSAEAAAELNLDEGRLTELSAKLGWNDPDAFRSFLLQYKRQWVADNQQYTDRFDLMLEQSLGDIALRVQGNVGLSGGQLNNAGVKALAAYPLNDDLKLIGGAGYDYQAAGATGDMGLNRGNGATIYGGVQFKDVPVTVGYRPRDNAWTIGLQIKF